VLFIMTEHDPTYTRDDEALGTVNRISLCLVVFSLVDLTKTLGCRLLSLRVNASSLFALLKVLTLQDILLFPVSCFVLLFHRSSAMSHVERSQFQFPYAPRCTFEKHCSNLQAVLDRESLKLMSGMQTTIQKERILNKLMTKARNSMQRGGNLIGGVTQEERLEAIAKLRDFPDWSVPQYLESLYELSLPVDDNAVTSFTDRITDLATQVPSCFISCRCFSISS
jgi:hypothetical protein